jgi:hypothetical protein
VCDVTVIPLTRNGGDREAAFVFSERCCSAALLLCSFLTFHYTFTMASSSSYNSSSVDNNNNRTSVVDDNALSLYDLDPSVAALLLEQVPPNNDITMNQLHNRIAIRKLQQATLVGHAKCAAHVLETALSQANKDKQSHFLLQQQIDTLQQQLGTLTAATATSATSSTITTPTNTVGVEEPSTTNNHDGEAQDPPERTAGGVVVADESSSSTVQRLQQELSAVQQREVSLQNTLWAHYEQQIDFLFTQEQTVTTQLSRLRQQRQSLHDAIQNTIAATATSAVPQDNPPHNDPQQQQQQQQQYKVLLDKLVQFDQQQQHEQSEGGGGTCVVCHDQPVTRAVIPCGHLCLCNSCCTTLVKQGGSGVANTGTATTTTTTTSTPQCPVCRGMLLSTLKIFFCSGNSSSSDPSGSNGVVEVRKDTA